MAVSTASRRCSAWLSEVDKRAVASYSVTVVTPAAASESAPTKRSTAVVSEAVEGAAGGSERLKRRAQGLRLGRYVSSRPVREPAAGAAESGDDDAPSASPPEQAPPDAGKRDPGAA